MCEHLGWFNWFNASYVDFCTSYWQLIALVNARNNDTNDDGIYCVRMIMANNSYIDYRIWIYMHLQDTQVFLLLVDDWSNIRYTYMIYDIYLCIVYLPSLRYDCIFCWVQHMLVSENRADT